MIFGIRLLGYLGPPFRLVRLAQVAEEVGFDYVWFPHDLFMDNSWIMTTAAGVLTKRIKVASVGTNPFTTDPCEIATYVGTLDRLTGGRAVVGIGAHTSKMLGWVGHASGDEAKDYGRIMQRTKEAVEIIRGLFEGKTVSLQGREFHWTSDCYLRFVPERRRVPVYVASYGAQFHELSGEIGDGSLPMLTPPEAAEDVISAITRGAKRAGRDSNEVDVAGCVWMSISKDAKLAEKTLRSVVSYFGPYLNENEITKVGLRSSDFDGIREHLSRGEYSEAEKLVSDKMLRLAIAGTPEECLKRVQELEKMGLTHVSIGGPIGPDPEESIRLIGKELIPHLRS